MSYTRFYRVWYQLKERCLTKNHKFYKYYGGRGIKVYDKWLEFSNFKSDMYKSYLIHCRDFGRKNTTIDRIDSNGNYEPSNCRWATRREQVLNTRRKILITYKDQTKPLSDWAKIIGVKYHIAYERVIRDKWSLDRAFFQPLYLKEKNDILRIKKIRGVNF